MTVTVIVAYLISAIFLVSIFGMAVVLKKIYNVDVIITRKLIHILTAPVFVLTWLLFPPEGDYRVLCSTLPFGASAVLFLLFIFKQSKTAQTFDEILSRSGDMKEVIEGPFFYGLLIGTLTILFYHSSPVGMIAMMTLCFGDGFAGVIGKYYDSFVIPSPYGTKTFYGCSSFLICSFISSIIYCYIFFNDCYIINSLILCCSGCIIEYASNPKWDNIFIVCGVTLIGLLLNW